MVLVNQLVKPTQRMVLVSQLVKPTQRMVLVSQRLLALLKEWCWLASLLNLLKE